MIWSIEWPPCYGDGGEGTRLLIYDGYVLLLLLDLDGPEEEESGGRCRC